MTKAQAAASKENKAPAKKRAMTLWVKSLFPQSEHFNIGYQPKEINKRQVSGRKRLTLRFLSQQQESHHGRRENLSQEEDRPISGGSGYNLASAGDWLG